MKYSLTALAVASALLFSCGNSETPKNNGSGLAEAQQFLDGYTGKYVQLYTRSSEAQWKANIEIKEGDSTNTVAARKADEAMAEFTGSKENIESARKFIAMKDKLTDLQFKQLERILYLAGNNPQTIADLVKQRIKAENDQTKQLFGYQYTLKGKKVTTNEIDAILKKENNLDKRLAAWNASKDIGPTLKTGLVNLRNLRNQTVQALGYPDYFT